MSVPTSAMDLPLEGAEDPARQICRQLLPGWDALSDQSMEVTTVSGGITNLLVKVTPVSASGLHPVVVRIFGANTDKIIDRAEELRKLLKLNASGFGAKVLGVFGNGRIEEFLQGRVVDLEELQLPDIQRKIAIRLAEFHSLISIAPTQECTFWDTLADWMSQAKELKLDDPKKQAELEQIDFQQYQAEIEYASCSAKSQHSVLTVLLPCCVVSWTTPRNCWRTQLWQSLAVPPPNRLCAHVLATAVS